MYRYVHWKRTRRARSGLGNGSVAHDHWNNETLSHTECSFTCLYFSIITSINLRYYQLTDRQTVVLSDLISLGAWFRIPKSLLVQWVDNLEKYNCSPSKLAVISHGHLFTCIFKKKNPKLQKQRNYSYLELLLYQTSTIPQPSYFTVESNM